MIKDNIKDILKRVKAAAERVNRDPDGIKLVCVTKGIDPYRINEAIISGITDIGENRLQEALAKKAQIMPGVKWHFIGHLQTNKVKDVIGNFDLIHSVDSVKLANKIDKEAGLAGKDIDTLLQVNTSGEESKYGISPEEVTNFFNDISSLQNLNIKGLMTITPLSDDPEVVRPCLKRLKEIFDKTKSDQHPLNVEMEYLSMGMSQDFEIAVEEGANIIRIGTAIFEDK